MLQIATQSDSVDSAVSHSMAAERLQLRQARLVLSVILAEMYGGQQLPKQHTIASRHLGMESVASAYRQAMTPCQRLHAAGARAPP